MDDLKAQSEKSNIIYSKSLEGILPKDLTESSNKNKFILNLLEHAYDLSFISAKKTKNGNICAFKIYNFNSISFLKNDKCSIVIDGESYEADFVKISENSENKDKFIVITVLLKT